MDITILLEDSNWSQIFNAAKRAHSNLSPQAKAALDRWLTWNWTTGDLSVDFKNGRTGVFSEIYNAFEPARNVMRKLYGDTVLLFRGMRVNRSDLSDTYDTSHDRLYSWTFDRKWAAFYANTRSVTPTLTPQQVDDLVNAYNRRGFVKYRSYTLKRNSEDHDSFIVYRGKEVITIDEDVREFIEQTEQDIADNNEEVNNQGTVFEKQIPISDIVWITNFDNDKEAIVIGHGQ